MPITSPDGFYFADGLTKMSAAAISAAEASSVQNAFVNFRTEIDERAQAAIAPGVIVRWPKVTDPPENWFLCDGRAVERAIFTELFEACGTFYGPGDGSTTFNLPDLTGDPNFDFIIKFRSADGLRGVQGPKGDAGTVDVGTTTAVNPDQNPSVSNSGDTNDAIFDFDLPRAPDVSVGTVSEVNPDQSPAVTDSGTDGDTVLDFDLPRAADVSVGTVTVVNPDQNPDVTDTGVDGDTVLNFGLPRAPDFQVGTVTTIPPGPASVTNVGTDGDIVLDFEIPQGVDGFGAPQHGQASRITTGTIAIAQQGVYQSTGLTATLDPATDEAIELGSVDSFGLKNVSGEERLMRFYASVDASVGGANVSLGIKLALDGVAIDETECRATTNIGGSEAKLVTSWLINVPNNSEVSVLIANHSGTGQITFGRGRIIAATVTGYGAGVAPGGTTGQVLAKTTDDDFSTGWVTPVSALNDLSDVDLTGVEDGETLVYDEATGKWIPGEGGGGGASLTVDSVAPLDPSEGDLWFNSVLGRTFVYYVDIDSSQWVEVGAGSGPTAAAVSGSAPTSPDLGQLWFDSETGNLYFYYVDDDGGQWVQVRSAAPAGLVNVDVVNPTAGQKLVYDGNNWVNLDGYTYVDTVYFTSSGTFTKASYPWLRAIRVKCQGGGGGGGGAMATFASQAAVGIGGNGGSYAESFITDISGLASSVTVTVGAGGAGAAAGGGGSTGNSSSFGSAVIGTGGTGGGAGPANPVPSTGNNVPALNATSTGDFVVEGDCGFINFAVSAEFPTSAGGGPSFLGRGSLFSVTGTGRAGGAGRPYGGGGEGGVNAQNQATARAGGAGGDGIVIVELYA